MDIFIDFKHHFLQMLIILFFIQKLNIRSQSLVKLLL